MHCSTFDKRARQQNCVGWKRFVVFSLGNNPLWRTTWVINWIIDTKVGPYSGSISFRSYSHWIRCKETYYLLQTPYTLQHDLKNVMYRIHIHGSYWKTFFEGLDVCVTSPVFEKSTKVLGKLTIFYRFSIQIFCYK